MMLNILCSYFLLAKLKCQKYLNGKKEKNFLL